MLFINRNKILKMMRGSGGGQEDEPDPPQGWLGAGPVGVSQDGNVGGGNSSNPQPRAGAQQAGAGNNSGQQGNGLGGSSGAGISAGSIPAQQTQTNRFIESTKNQENKYENQLTEKGLAELKKREANLKTEINKEEKSYKKNKFLFALFTTITILVGIGINTKYGFDNLSALESLDQHAGGSKNDDLSRLHFGFALFGWILPAVLSAGSLLTMAKSSQQKKHLQRKQKALEHAIGGEVISENKITHLDNLVENIEEKQLSGAKKDGSGKSWVERIQKAGESLTRNF